MKYLLIIIVSVISACKVSKPAEAKSIAGIGLSEPYREGVQGIVFKGHDGPIGVAGPQCLPGLPGTLGDVGSSLNGINAEGELVVIRDDGRLRWDPLYPQGKAVLGQFEGDTLHVPEYVKFIKVGDVVYSIQRQATVRLADAIEQKRSVIMSVPVKQAKAKK